MIFQCSIMILRATVYRIDVGLNPTTGAMLDK